MPFRAASFLSCQRYPMGAEISGFRLNKMNGFLEDEYSHLDSTVAQKPVGPPPPKWNDGSSGQTSAGLESALPFLATPFLLGGCCQVAGI